MQPVLTIAIPTYNRPHRVSERLREILAQCPSLDSIEILVLDNASTENIESKVLESLPSARNHVRFNRNVANIGLAGNICRCFEVARGAWVWTLGDDDKLETGAVESVMTTISKYGNEKVGGMNFSTGIHLYPELTSCRSLADYCAIMKVPEAFSNALFLSSCVFRKETFLKYLRFAFLGMSTAAPHIVVPIKAVNDGFEHLLIPAKLVHWELPPSSERWCGFSVAKSLPLLGETLDCDELLSNFSSGYRIHMPGDLRIKAAISRIFLDPVRPPRYWHVYYNRVSPYLRGSAFVRATCFGLIAAMASGSSNFRGIGSWFTRLLGVDFRGNDHGSDRL